MDEITYPFPSFNGTTVEVWEWLSSFIPHFTVRVIFLCILELKLIYVDLRGPWVSCLDEGGITLKAVKKHLFCWIVAFISIFFRCSPAFFSYSKIRYINASNANECKPNECKTTGLLSVTYCVYVSYEHAYIIFKFHNCNGHKWPLMWVRLSAAEQTRDNQTSCSNGYNDTWICILHPFSANFIVLLPPIFEVLFKILSLVYKTSHGLAPSLLSLRSNKGGR